MAIMPSERLNTFQDRSGLVTVGVFRSTGAPAQHHFDEAANVAEDMVAIGGGAVGAEFPSGGLLTASYPNQDLSAWLASSKDHMVAQVHVLTTYAIGLSIFGMSRARLLDAIHVSTDESGLASLRTCRGQRVPRIMKSHLQLTSALMQFLCARICQSVKCGSLLTLTNREYLLILRPWPT